MTNHAVVRAALDCAATALSEAATDLTLAVVLAGRDGVLMNEARILAEAVEAELRALEETMRRHESGHGPDRSYDQSDAQE
jgi:hypothetical protein